MSKLLEKLLPALLASATLASPLSAQDGPSYKDILAGFSNPERWLTYSGDYSGKRHSPLQQITPENVSGLRPVWTFQTGTTTEGAASRLRLCRRWCAVCYRFQQQRLGH